MNILNNSPNLGRQYLQDYASNPKNTKAIEKAIQEEKAEIACAQMLLTLNPSYNFELHRFEIINTDSPPPGKEKNPGLDFLNHRITQLASSFFPENPAKQQCTVAFFQSKIGQTSDPKEILKRLNTSLEELNDGVK